MKKLPRICQLAIAAFVIGFSSYSALAIPIVSIQPNTATPAVGSSFDLFVNIGSVADLFAFQFDISFNRTVLSAVSVTEGPFFSSGGTTFFIPGTIDNTAGAISFTSDSLIGALAGVTGSGTLAKLTFSALAQGNSPIGLSNVALLDSGLNDIPFNTAGGGVNPTRVPEPPSALLVAVGLWMIGRFRRTAGI